MANLRYTALCAIRRMWRELLDLDFSNPQILCSQKAASIRGSLGPFGLLIWASKASQEHTAVLS
ncbi:Glycosyl hydrolase [Trema orientale]|uniref:Glycosyl hydrolase n=1 Tax=Trema orientale TaxID=63057 RepID=A0A2P5FEG6_TREOI|nr:Glycosyl hydrolase [Trema orientale]